MSEKKQETKHIEDIDLDFVKNYLRVDYDDDDDLIIMMMEGAKALIQTILNLSWSELEGIYGKFPSQINIAFLTIVAHWYDRRELQSYRATEKELGYVFTGILYPIRDWNGGPEGGEE